MEIEKDSKMINIRQLPVWLGQKIKDGDSPLFVKPRALKTLYKIFFYEYVKYTLSMGNTLTESDADINLPETVLIEMIQIYYNHKCNAFFQTLDSL